MYEERSEVMFGAAAASSRHAGVEAPAGWSERWLAVDEGVELRVLERVLPGGEGRVPVVFVAGWISVVEGWAPVLERLAMLRPVVYVETREKRSARLERARLRSREFTVRRLALDLVSLARALGPDVGRAVWFGSSMGANAILEALKDARLPARGAFLVGPNAAFSIPWWGRLLLWAPSWIYHVVKYLVMWYLRHFRVDAAAEPEQMLRYERTLHAAQPLRLKLSARAVSNYRVQPRLETIRVPVTVAYAPTDRLHGEQEVNAIVGAIPSGSGLRCPSNAYMHDARIVDDLERFIAGLGLD